MKSANHQINCLGSDNDALIYSSSAKIALLFLIYPVSTSKHPTAAEEWTTGIRLANKMAVKMMFIRVHYQIVTVMVTLMKIQNYIDMCYIIIRSTH